MVTWSRTLFNHPSRLGLSSTVWSCPCPLLSKFQSPRTRAQMRDRTEPQRGAMPYRVRADVCTKTSGQYVLLPRQLHRRRHGHPSVRNEVRRSCKQHYWPKAGRIHGWLINQYKLIIESLNDWRVAIRDKRSVLVAYIDYTDAFDTGCRARLLSKLTGSLHNWITNFLKDCTYGGKQESGLHCPTPSTLLVLLYKELSLDRCYF